MFIFREKTQKNVKKQPKTALIILKSKNRYAIVAAGKICYNREAGFPANLEKRKDDCLMKITTKDFANFLAYVNSVSANATFFYRIDASDYCFTVADNGVLIEYSGTGIAAEAQAEIKPAIVAAQSRLIKVARIFNEDVIS